MRVDKFLEKYTFFLALFFSLAAPYFFPSFRFLFFAPYLVVSLYRLPFFQALGRAFFCGLFFDLVSSHPYFGLTCIVYSISLTLLSSQKYNFFEDKLSTLPLMCALFSFISTLCEALCFALFGGKITLNFRWVFTELFAMAFFDALYALILFALPFNLIKRIAKFIRLVVSQKVR